MKKTYLFLLAATCACTPAKDNLVTLKIGGVPNDTLFITTSPVSDRFQQLKDTLTLVDGQYIFRNEGSELQEIRVSMKTENGYRTIAFPVFPGEGAEINGDMDRYEISGNRFYTEYQQYLEQLRPTESEMQQTLALVSRLQKAHAPSDSIMKAYAPVRELSTRKSDLTMEYIRNHPDSDVSVWLLQQISMKQSKEAMELLTDSVKNGRMSSLFQVQKMRIEQENARREAAKSVIEGTAAPEFSGKDIQGKPFRLSDFRGKYVVVDFWGTWCGFCIKGMPEMKATYEKVHERFEFIGIACNDPEDKWKKKVEELELPWVNMLNSVKDDISVKYGVSAYPTKLIIDRDGRILMKCVGEKPEFYQFIEQIMAGKE